MLKVDRLEVLRYLGMAQASYDANFLTRLEAVEQAVLAAVRPQAVWQRVDERTYYLVATLGTEVDALLRRYGQVAPADLVMAQAVATALIETYCDQCEAEIGREVPEMTLLPRVSPGYGDIPLERQRDLLARVDATRRLGVTLTEVLLMVPSKSVSAIIGLQPKEGDV